MIPSDSATNLHVTVLGTENKQKKDDCEMSQTVIFYNQKEEDGQNTMAPCLRQCHGVGTEG